MSALDKHLQLIKDHELVYGEWKCVDCGMILIKDVEKILRDFAREIEAEVVFKHFNKKD